MLPLADRLRALRALLPAGLVERDDAVGVALLAALAGEHVLLVGPPGTARRTIARRLRLAFAGATLSERLVTPTTAPDEIADLPAAPFAFLDEPFEANGAVRNALLAVLDGRDVAAVAACVEPSADAERDALFDRFLLRVRVEPVSPAAFPSLIAAREGEPDVPADVRLTADDLERLRAEEVEVPAAVVALLGDLRAFCAEERLAVSDRRWRRAVGVLQVAAAANGRRAVSPADCALLRHCLWTRPAQRDAIDAWLAARLAATGADETRRADEVIATWAAKLASDRERRAQARDAAGRPLFAGADGAPTTSPTGPAPRARHGEPLFLAPPGAVATNGMPITDPTRGDRGYTAAELDALRLRGLPGNAPLRPFRSWPGRHDYLADPASRLLGEEALPPLLGPAPQTPADVERALAALDALDRELANLRDALVRALEALECRDLWPAPEVLAPAAAALRARVAEVNALGRRLAELRDGFAALPLAGPN